MSGLQDLANWALGGGAGNNNNNNNNNEQAEEQPSAVDAPPPLTAQEMRAQRMARLQALSNSSNNNQDDPQPMEIDEIESKPKKAKPTPSPPPPPIVVKKELPPSPKKPSTNFSPGEEQSRRLQRKKEMLLQKTLQVQLKGSNSSNMMSDDNGVVQVDINSTDITVSSIAEILATRLSAASTPHAMHYLGTSFNRSCQEFKTLKNASNNTNSNNKKKAPPQELLDILNEMIKQLVSYTATCLVEPDLFPVSKDAPLQLAQCLLKSTQLLGSASSSSSNNPNENNLTFPGVTGKMDSSFYHLVVDELQRENGAALQRTVAIVVHHYVTELLSKFDSALDGSVTSTVLGESISVLPLSVVTALNALVSHKTVAAMVTQLDSFLLPAPGTAAATAQHRPPMPSGTNPLQQLLMNPDAHKPYLGRSGPALESQTVLGRLARLGAPKNNPSFPVGGVTRQSLPTIESAYSVQRSQLAVYQTEVHRLNMNLIKGGKEARVQVLQWFTDALLVNVGASALRPDLSKVSSTSLLLNVSVLLLKLCDPFVKDDTKQHMIDPGFVSSSSSHGGVYAVTGDDAVPRLGATEEGAPAVLNGPYEPKNAFIPQCFFFCARSLHFGLVSQLSQHENLLRNISYLHHDLSSNNRDIHSDPRFSALLARQRSTEVGLFQDEMIEPTLRFLNFTAKVLFDMDDEVLRTMPEDFVSDICSVLRDMAQQKAKMLGGHDFRYVFKLVVKLLSAKYASMVRNYNLRAQLGDVLYEIFLPRDGNDRRDVPSSVSCDLQAGGKTFLLSDASAQENLAPSLLLLYGEVEHTGYYEKMSHRAKIASLIKYLWESAEHRPAFRRITQNKDSFIKFANGIINETNTLIATVMQKLPEIREAQEKMANTAEWSRLSEDEQGQVTSRLEDNEREVKSSLPLCNKTMQMFGYLNTDNDIRSLFLCDELCSRLVTMLVHVLTKLVGSKGLELKVDNPEQYDFRPKEMLQDLCAIFGLFASSSVFREECAKSGCDPILLRKAVSTCQRLNLLTGESMEAFQSLPDAVEVAARQVANDEQLLVDAPDEFLDEILSTFMKDPVVLPSGHYVDRSTITQHLLNDPTDPFNREPLTMDKVKPAVELKEKMTAWLAEKRASRN